MSDAPQNGLSPNLNMPLLYAAQVQKEITHNEALILIDALLVGVVESVASDPAGLWHQPGRCWIVGADGIAEFQNRANQIACWTEGGWRFVPARTGMQMFNRGLPGVCRFEGDTWVAAAAWQAPTGGTTIDAQARQAISNMALALQKLGLIRPM